MTTLLGSRGAPVAGVIVDLDDTIYPQRRFLEGACEAVVECAALRGADREAMRAALAEALGAGSDGGHVIDRALDIAGASIPAEPLVEAFRRYVPRRLEPYPGVAGALVGLSRRLPLALVTDGDPTGQLAKLDATGLRHVFSAVILSDDYGRSHRKPDRVPFEAALRALGLPASRVVMVGDRPDKDVAGAAAIGMRALRVRTGEYAHVEDHPSTWAVSDTLAEAAAFLGSFVEGAQETAPAGILCAAQDPPDRSQRAGWLRSGTGEG